MKMPGLKFDKDAIGGLLLNHVEKLVVGIVGILGLALAWNGIAALRTKTVSTDKQPKAVAQLSQETTQHIDAEPKLPGELVRKPGELAKAIEPWRAPTIDAEPPSLAILSRPTVTTVAKRTAPKALPIQDLRAIAGVAVFKDQRAEQEAAAAGADPGMFGGATPVSGNPDYEEPVKRYERLAPYVVIVGLVPVAQQRSEFRRALGEPAADQSGIVDAQQDLPRWADYVVERAAADKPDAWLAVRVRPAVDQMGTKPLPERFLLGPNELAAAAGGDMQAGYAMPLPARLYEPWGLDTIHPWFLQPRHKWRIEQGEQIAETPVRLNAAAFRQEFPDHAGHQVELLGMKFVGAPQRTGSPETMVVHVSSADDAESFPPLNPAEPAAGAATPAAAVTKPVFAIASAWMRTLDLAAAATWNLRVVLTNDGGLPMATVIGVTPIGPDGTPGPEQLDPRLVGSGGGGGGVPEGGGGGGRGGEFAGGMPGAGIGVDHGPEFRLFRFIDDTVETGKTYRYRVKLDLVNPNFGLDPRLLADAQQAAQELIPATSDATAPIVVPAPYVLAARASLKGEPRTAAAEATTTPAKPASKGPQLARHQVEVSFLGPSWERMRGKRPDQGFDPYDLAVEHVLPVEPGGTVLWKRARKPKDKGKTDPKAAKGAEKPKPADPRWRLIVDADLGRDLVDARGRQAADVADAKKEAAATTSLPPEPVEMVFLRPDGGLEVVTAADSQRILGAYRSDAAMMPMQGGEPGFLGEQAPPPRGL